MFIMWMCLLLYTITANAQASYPCQTLVSIAEMIEVAHSRGKKLPVQMMGKVGNRRDGMSWPHHWRAEASHPRRGLKWSIQRIGKLLFKLRKSDLLATVEKQFQSALGIRFTCMNGAAWDNFRYLFILWSKPRMSLQ